MKVRTSSPRWFSLAGVAIAGVALAGACASSERASFDSPAPPAVEAPAPAAEADPCATVVCPAQEACCAGACSSDPTCKLTLKTSSSANGFVGGGAYLTLRGSGFARGLRAYVGDGRAPVRVIDDTTALVVTPPAVVGEYDLKVALDGKTASLPKGFRYHAVGFTDKWVKIQMSTARGNFPAVALLQDGRVLLVGGLADGSPNGALTTADIYDPTTQTTSLAPGAMSVGRFSASAITLLDGRALVFGVCNSPGGTGCPAAASRPLVDAFDPKTNTFSLLPSRLVDDTRFYVRPALLPDGRVLVVSMNNPTAEIFDPRTNAFSMLPHRSSFASFGFPARLRDGRVALVSKEGIEIYDADADVLSKVAGASASSPYAAFTLPDGRVMMPGGTDEVGPDFVPSPSIGIFDPATSTMSALPQALLTPRMKYGGALLRDGTVMVAAGTDEAYPKSASCFSSTFPTTAAVDIIDPIGGTVKAFTPLQEPNMELVATTLLDGSVLLAGGSPCGGAGAYPYVYYLQSIPTSIK
jgi:hypothetical protein